MLLRLSATGAGQVAASMAAAVISSKIPEDLGHPAAGVGTKMGRDSSLAYMVNVTPAWSPVRCSDDLAHLACADPKPHKIIWWGGRGEAVVAE